MTKSVSSLVKDTARLEADLEDKGKWRKRTLTRVNKKPKDMPISAFYSKVVRVSELPIIVDNGMLPNDCRATRGFFTITYNPEGSPKRAKDKPYTFGQDFIQGRFCVSGLKHFKALCKRIPDFAFIVKWSNFDEGLFAVAKQHPGVPFPFNLNWAAYGRYIDQKAEEMGIDIDHKPFFVYITKKDKLAELRKKYQMLPNPDKEDYESVLEEVDKEMK